MSRSTADMNRNCPLRGKGSIVELKRDQHLAAWRTVLKLRSVPIGGLAAWLHKVD